MRKWLLMAFAATLCVPSILMWFVPMGDPDTLQNLPENDQLVFVLFILTCAAIIFSIIFAVMNFHQAIVMNKRISPGDKRGRVVGTLAILKFVLIFFYINLSLFWIGFAFMASTLFTFVLWVFVPLGFLYGGMVVVVSAALGISQIVFLGREGVLTKSQCVIHSVLQLIPVVDAVDCLCVHLKVKKQLTSGL